MSDREPQKVDRFGQLWSKVKELDQEERVAIAIVSRWVNSSQAVFSNLIYNSFINLFI